MNSDSSPQPDPDHADFKSLECSMAERLASEPILAVDTESNSLYRFSRSEVCLIQFSTPKDDYLVDPLALGDLSPLESPMFADPQIEKGVPRGVSMI